MAKVLAEALGEKDRYTKGHSLRVTGMVLNLAHRLGLQAGDEETETLRLSAILHDIGKIGVPDSVLRKTERLSGAEWLAIRQHPENSEKILQGLEPDIALTEIEKCAGSQFDPALANEFVAMIREKGGIIKS